MTWMSTAEIVVTGMGVVSPAGSTVDDFWTTMLQGESMAAPLEDVSEQDDTTYIGCRVQGFDPTEYVSAKDARRLDPFALYALSGAIKALEDAGSPVPDQGRGAIVLGNAVGGQTIAGREHGNYFNHGTGRVNPLMPLQTMPNAAASKISIQLGWRGPALTIATTCASGADAIGIGAGLLKSGQADVVIAGGAEAIITNLALAAFTNLNAMSGRLDDPTRASRPFDAARDGFVIGEGAAFVILERRGDANARGATTRGVVAGYAASSDAFHVAMPHETGLGASDAMRGAIASAGLIPSEIVHVNAHGTSTPRNDEVEALAIRKVLDDDQVPVTAPKGVTGHLIGAAGALEFISTVLAVENQIVPPTANTEELSPGMEIDLVRGAPRPIPSGPALSNSFGFGGHNASLVVTPA